MKILSSLWLVCMKDALLILWESLCVLWIVFNVFFPSSALAFRTTHGKNNTRKCDTEGFVPDASLNGVVGSLSLFIRSLIGITVKIWYVVYINEKVIYASKTFACTISEFENVRNVLHVTSTFTFISWCYGAANVKWTPCVWHAYWNSVELNCVYADTQFTST